ncbi:unnamed protein product [Rotaria magnacalcarata]|uniref:Endonuclease/exonuclease/phosphatase domain-containing protein n=2 Tax=Rotaria magnacalcarata TaxID=392030 RepID=A0A816V452_9BILA|nr:unnamed protein product [Rotaria magnacalcarata]
MTLLLIQIMNPNSKEFIPNHRTESFHISTEALSRKQAQIFQELILEWTTTPTLNTLLANWEDRKKITSKMLNAKSELKIMLLNVSSLKHYLPDIFLLLESTPCPIVVFNGTHHHNDTVKLFSRHFSNCNVYWEAGSNNFGGVLIAIHRSIPVQRVDIFQNQSNIVVLDVGTTTDKFQLATCYSPPNEKLPINLFDKILERSTNTILLGDFNAKHQSWSDSIENQKDRVLFNWLSTNDLEIVNKHVATSTRSNATIDLILAPAHMIPSTSSYSVLPCIGNDHFPIIWTPAAKLQKRDCLYPVKRTYWTLVKLFLTFTFSYWNNQHSKTDDSLQFFSSYERFLSLLVFRLTYVYFCKAYKPSLPPHIIKLIHQKKTLLRLQINDIDVQGYFNDWHDNLLENDYDHPLFDNKEMLCSYSRKSLEDRNHKWSLQMAITYVFREFLDKTRTQSSWSRSLDLSRLKRSFIPNMKQKTIVKQMIQYAVNDCLAVTKLTKLLDLT